MDPENRRMGFRVSLLWAGTLFTVLGAVCVNCLVLWHVRAAVKRARPSPPLDRATLEKKRRRHREQLGGRGARA